MGPQPTFTNKKGDWYLHGKVVSLRNGHRQHIYWFARKIDYDTVEGVVPAGMAIMETKRTGMPVLHRV